MSLPLDHPTPERPHRVYVALTNHCNRSCPWCSTCSSPAGTTFLPVSKLESLLPPEGLFQLQLEGGEPTVHPDFWEFVRLARTHPRCDRMVLCTNGATLPHSKARLQSWLERLGAPLTVKLSANHYLMERDPGLMELCVAARDALAALGGDRQLVINVRLRRGYHDDDAAVRAAVTDAGLLPHANVFFLQSYGFARNESGWDAPRPVWDRFTLINPDGTVFGPDLIARSDAMGELG